MKRFNYDENDDFDDEYVPSDDFSEYEDDDYYEEGLVVGENYINVNGNNKSVNINHNKQDSGILQKDINRKLLFKVIATLEKSWFWMFYSNSYKIKKIKEMYDNLLPLINILKEEVSKIDGEIK